MPGEMYDVAIVGSGAFGAAAGWRLAKAGKRVIAIDRWGGPHVHGSSHGHTRMTRTAYYERPEYVPMLLRAHELWRELERGCGEKLLEMCGGIYMGAEDSELITGATGAARLHGLAHELVSAEELARRYPQFQVGTGWVGLHESMAGYLMVEKCVGAMIEAGMSLGMELRLGRVLSIEQRSGGVEVSLEDGGRVVAEKVILTAGAWLSTLLPALSVTPTRQVLVWVWPRDAERFRGGPVWAFDVGGGRLLYGFPMLPDRPGLKAAVHAPAKVTDPDAVDRTIRESDVELIRGHLRQRIPLAAEGTLLHATTCLYENSADGHFLLGPLSDRIIVGGGGSGHGFKFAPVVGEVLADFAVRGQSRLSVEFLSPRRFGSA